MSSAFALRFRKTYHKVVHSIAFLPALIAVGFLLLSIVMLDFDFSETGKHFKSSFKWIRLRDTDTARTILSTIIGGLISLTVFSFSMVMILLNQTASQLSNRALASMISNRFHQVVLGFYIGSIVYALSLLTTIRDIESGIYVPALSIYLLLLITVFDILLFIYFLHYVTQQVKYETNVKHIHNQTMTALEKSCRMENGDAVPLPAGEPFLFAMPQSDYFQGYDQEQFLHFVEERNAIVKFLHPTGTYLLKGEPLLHYHGPKPLTVEEEKELSLMLDFYKGEPIEQNFFYGMRQLTEIALRALSPGINDPQTAVLTLHALANTYGNFLQKPLQAVFTNRNGRPCVYVCLRSEESVFEECFYPVWDYGKDDRYVQQAMWQMMKQLVHTVGINRKPFLDSFLQVVEKAVQKKREGNIT